MTDLDAALASAPASAPTWVLVEGASDVAAIRALRAARGVLADEEPCMVVDMGGATNVRRELGRVLRLEPRPRVVGLCDEREAPFVVRALDAHRALLGLEDRPSLSSLPALGFHVCRRDLEDELLRGLGLDRALGVLDGLGLDAAFRAFTRQPAWQGRPLLEQLRRFGSTTSGRKELLAGAYAAAVDVPSTPPPLAALLSSMPLPADVAGSVERAVGLKPSRVPAADVAGSAERAVGPKPSPVPAADVAGPSV